MENAALAAGEVLEARFGAALRVSLICGAGNNGGDGLALARHLHSRGREVVVLLCASRHDLRGDAALQAGVLEAMTLDLSEVSGETYESALQQVAGSDLVVDALFGTGLSRPIEGWRAALIEGVNAQRVPVISLDLPSGLPATSSTMTGTCIDAVATVSFFAPKPSLVLPPSASRAGEVYVADLGVPESALGRIAPRVHLTTAADLRVPRRAAESHKGSFGHLVVAAGSHGKSGAGVLAARGAVEDGSRLTHRCDPRGSSFGGRARLRRGDDAGVGRSRLVITGRGRGEHSSELRGGEGCPHSRTRPGERRRDCGVGTGGGACCEGSFGARRGRCQCICRTRGGVGVAPSRDGLDAASGGAGSSSLPADTSGQRGSLRGRYGSRRPRPARSSF